MLETPTAPNSFLVTPQQTFSAARRSGLDNERLDLSGVAVMTFSKAVVERLEELCTLVDAEWLSPHHHPYAAPHLVKRGAFRGVEVVALVPAMGASPLACTVEELVACGVEAVFLVCAAWSLGPPVAFGDLIVPSFSLGRDGTSIHYGNGQGKVQAGPEVVNALVEACRALGARYHVGGERNLRGPVSGHVGDGHRLSTAWMSVHGKRRGEYAFRHSSHLERLGRCVIPALRGFAAGMGSRPAARRELSESLSAPGGGRAGGQRASQTARIAGSQMISIANGWPFQSPLALCNRAKMC